MQVVRLRKVVVVGSSDLVDISGFHMGSLIGVLPW